MKNKSRLKKLIKAINQWQELPRSSMSNISIEVVQSCHTLNMMEALNDVGIFFKESDNPVDDARINAQKLFRWLGTYDEHVMPDRLFYVEPAILHAMPAQIRREYLNSVYSGIGVFIELNDNCISDEETLNTAQVAQSITKENSEAVVAVLGITDKPSNNQVIDTHRELMESAAVSQQGAQLLETKYPQLFSNQGE